MYSGWVYKDTREIMSEIAALTPIYAGVSHERLERGDVLLWPVRSFADSGSPILYESDSRSAKPASCPSAERTRVILSDRRERRISLLSGGDPSFHTKSAPNDIYQLNNLTAQRNLFPWR